MVDLVRELIGQKRSYANARGADRARGIAGPPAGQPVAVPNTLIPRTTWADVLVVGPHVERHVEAGDFVRTRQFRRALENFQRQTPAGRGLLSAAETRMDQVYPHNELFWGYALRLAKARSAAGVVPSWSDVAVESVIEAAEELPDRLRDALEAVDPRNLIPDVSGVAKFVKWATIAGGLGMLYWYVLRPRSKKGDK